MPRKLSYEEKFERFKEKFKNGWFDDFMRFCEMSDTWQEIKEGLIKEKRRMFKDE